MWQNTKNQNTTLKKNLYYICWGEGTVFWYYFPKPGTPLCLRLQHSTSGILCLSTDATNLPYCCVALLQKQRESWALGRWSEGKGYWAPGVELALPQVLQHLRSVPPCAFLFNRYSQFLKELSAELMSALSCSVSCPGLYFHAGS